MNTNYAQPATMGTTPVCKMSISDIVQKLNEIAVRLRHDVTELCTNRGEIGSAELLSEIAKDWIAFDVDSNEWHIYNGLHWSVDRGGNVKTIASKVLSNAFKMVSQQAHDALLAYQSSLPDPTRPTEQEAKQITTLKNLEKLARSKMVAMFEISNIKKVLEFTQATSLLGVLGDIWDSKRNLLGVDNAVIDLDLGDQIAPCAKQYIRTIAPVDFVPSARCPKFEKAAYQIHSSNDEKDAYARRQLGYSMGGACTESDLFVWYGKDGRNGKEFILERIKKVLGDKLAGVVEPELLLSSKAQRVKNSATEGLMALRGRRIAWCSESNEGRVFDNATMKDLSGGHVLTGRRNHGHQEEWARTHTLFMLTNHKPHVAGGGGGAEWDRIKLLEFTESFVNEPDPTNPHQHKKDPTLASYIDENERSGVLNWLIRGYLEWKEFGLMTPDCVKEATKGYKEEEDTIGGFLAECCEETGDPTDYATVQSIYNSYKQWSSEVGERYPMGRGSFSKRIEERYKKEKRPEGYAFLGIKVISIGVPIIPQP